MYFWGERTPIMIPFHQPALTGKEAAYVQEAMQSLHWSGNGAFTKQCMSFFQQQFGWQKNLLTTSCSDALEMACMLADWPAGAEVIIPSFHFVSAGNAVVRSGGVPVFADSMAAHPNIDVAQIESLITRRTRAILPVHYAGVACDMDALQTLADRHGLIIIEDAALALGATYRNKPLGSFGTFAAFSFHDTKTISCGEGGLLVVNDRSFDRRADIIWEKGTNRSAFLRGETDKYGWVDVGGSFLPSELLAAFLLAQLQRMDEIHSRRMQQWKRYNQALQGLADEGRISLPHIPDYAGHNAHIFYLICADGNERNALQQQLRERGIQTAFHYQALHRSPYFAAHHSARPLIHAERFSDTLLRLPLYHALSENAQEQVIDGLLAFYR